LTQSTFLADYQGSETVCKQGLSVAIKQQLLAEKASFHTPGHKGRLTLDIEETAFAADLTELPGLDELANASGVLFDLQQAIASIWQARKSLISVNGASAALVAAILACARRGSEILLPVNVHRSALSALIQTGLDPIWYRPDWLADWGTWGAANIQSFQQVLESRAGLLAAAVVVSPNYAGVLSDLERIAHLCRKQEVLLIVDEAHGAHLLPDSSLPTNALQSGADLVCHSLHKTLCAPTQTGILQIGKNCPLEDGAVRAALNTLQSSSPSYLLMLGIEKSLAYLEENTFKKSLAVAAKLRSMLSRHGQLKILEGQETDPLHVLVQHKNLSAGELYQSLSAAGIYAETVLGRGVLLLSGLGSQDSDLDCLSEALAAVEKEAVFARQSSTGVPFKEVFPEPQFSPQHVNPRRAFFADYRWIYPAEAEGEISCDGIAPCPPGYPVLAPGQRINRETIKILKNDISIRVVNHPQLEGDSDGSNTAC
jgi:arginine decarboxylase